MIRAKKPHQPVKYSEQAVLNCMKGGCGGDDPAKAMAHFVRVGVTLEKYDPYVERVSDCA